MTEVATPPQAPPPEELATPEELTAFANHVRDSLQLLPQPVHLEGTETLQIELHGQDSAVLPNAVRHKLIDASGDQDIVVAFWYTEDTKEVQIGLAPDRGEDFNPLFMGSLRRYPKTPIVSYVFPVSESSRQPSSAMFSQGADSEVWETTKAELHDLSKIASLLA